MYIVSEGQKPSGSSMFAGNQKKTDSEREYRNKKSEKHIKSAEISEKESTAKELRADTIAETKMRFESESFVSENKLSENKLSESVNRDESITTRVQESIFETSPKSDEQK